MRIRSLTRRLVSLVLLPLSSALAGPLAAADLDLVGVYDSGLGAGAAEISAYDPLTRRLFVVNAVDVSIDVVDLDDPSQPQLVTQVDLAPYGSAVQSVAVSKGLAAAAVAAEPATDPGRVVFFSPSGLILADFTVGALPDMVTFTPDGDKLLVANEGEPNDAYTIDPEGSLSIIDVAGGLPSAIVTTIGFSEFNVGGPRAAEFPAGARVYFGDATPTRAENLEPESVAVSADSSTAWVTLQEANALAVFDLTLDVVDSIVALGDKNYSLPGVGFDASDRDGPAGEAAISIRNFPVRGLYQPDAITAFEVGGETFLATANEGDARAWTGGNEEVRLGNASYVLDPTAFPDAATLKENGNLGRLNVTNQSGDVDDDGDFDVIYAYGARSFSIRDHQGALVWDSGERLEQLTAELAPSLFNSEENDPGEFDGRSDNKGPEPEAVAIGRVGAHLYAFVGLERIGGLMVFRVTDPAAPQFVHYEPGAPELLSPEGLFFVAPEASPNGAPLVVVAHEVSGTVGIFDVSRVVEIFLDGFEGGTTAAWSSVEP